MVYNYDWSSTYAQAVLESDQAKVGKRILEAEVAILWRTREPELTRREWQAIEVAMDVLRDMRMRRHIPLYEHRYSGPNSGFDSAKKELTRRLSHPKLDQRFT